MLLPSLSTIALRGKDNHLHLIEEKLEAQSHEAARFKAPQPVLGEAGIQILLSPAPKSGLMEVQLRPWKRGLGSGVGRIDEAGKVHESQLTVGL